MNKAILSVLLFCAALVLANTIQVHRLQGQADENSQAHRREDLGAMQTVTTNWTSAVGEHSVTTTQLPDETLAEWRARHAAAVKAMQELFPPI